MRKLAPDATWTAAGIGPAQLQVNRWSLELGGHCRTGLADNVRFDKGRVAAMCGEYGRHAASVEEARGLLGL